MEEGLLAYLTIQVFLQYLGDVHKNAVKTNQVSHIPYLTFHQKSLE
jgi:hypothetical protein